MEIMMILNKIQLFRTKVFFVIFLISFYSDIFAQVDIPETSPLFEHVIQLPVNLEMGRHIFSVCSTCHQKKSNEANSRTNFIPQLAGQHRQVIIKQLTDFISGKRINKIMSPVMMNEHFGNPQSIADVSSYAATLSASENSKGIGNDLELGKDLYRVHCLKCHGKDGLGDNQKLIPKLQGQHYEYMLSQFIRVRNGQRSNTDLKMRRQISRFSFREMQAVIDYSSRLKAE
jgi:cytochrome c553